MWRPGLLEEEGSFKNGLYLNAQCPLPISIVSGDGVTDVSHIPIISTIDGGCKILAWDQLLVVQV